ncbi:hypothetical protein L2E82_25433 [Cichorium intybus]|uniref:Uncharacterized protein n=1 Tax=Cichorium intybus TaxID=13427 RepID=A0ACB9E3S5_CICIN|nr:hypothetical protein L2E82_25433 [Cichorium intybus]
MITAHVRTCLQFSPTFCLILSEKSITQATVATPHSRRCRFLPLIQTPFPSSISKPKLCHQFTLHLHFTHTHTHIKRLPYSI